MCILRTLIQIKFFALFFEQVLEKTLEKCGDDIDAAIKCLHELCIGTSGETLGSLNHVDALAEQGLYFDRVICADLSFAI